MFNTIVAGSDGHRGRGAAALAQLVASASGARLLLVGVCPDHAPPLADGRAQKRAALEADLDRLRVEFAPTASTQIVLDHSAPHALRRIADEQHADLVVVGARRHRPLERLVGADHALQVLHGAPCAVAVVPDHLPARRRLDWIGVGIDGSPESTAALDMAIELARLADAQLRLLAVADDVYAGSPDLVATASYGNTYELVVEARLHAARAAVDHALERCGSVAADGDTRLGDPSSELVELGTGCDLLLLGSHRWGAVRRLALGSVSERVIRSAICPVIVPACGAAQEHAVAEHGAAAG